jgi:Gas vesicle protein
MSNEQGNTTFFMGLLLGAFVGGTVAGLLTPRSGEETRTMVRERGLELKDRAEDVVLRAQNVANDTVVKVKQRIASDNAA